MGANTHDQFNFSQFFSPFADQGIGRAAWSTIETDTPLTRFISDRIEADDQKKMHNPDFHRIVTPAILYVLDRSAKNGVSITEVVRALRPRHGETFLRGGQAEDKKILGRFKESNRELLRHVDKDTLKEAEQFLCHPLSFGSRFKYWPPQRPPAR